VAALMKLLQRGLEPAEAERAADAFLALRENHHAPGRRCRLNWGELQELERLDEPDQIGPD